FAGERNVAAAELGSGLDGYFGKFVIDRFNLDPDGALVHGSLDRALHDVLAVNAAIVIQDVLRRGPDVEHRFFVATFDTVLYERKTRGHAAIHRSGATGTEERDDNG